MIASTAGVAAASSRGVSASWKRRATAAPAVVAEPARDDLDERSLAAVPLLARRSERDPGGGNFPVRNGNIERSTDGRNVLIAAFRYLVGGVPFIGSGARN